jgi:F0F1-type ATP synthase membrane subunit c/vacuolar-type H+-ATPase subunit K
MYVAIYIALGFASIAASLMFPNLFGDGLSVLRHFKEDRSVGGLILVIFILVLTWPIAAWLMAREIWRAVRS